MTVDGTLPAEPDLGAAARAMTDPATYADRARFHEVAARLRRDAPIAFADAPGLPSVWVVTRHADVFAISKDPQVWRNQPRSVLLPLALAAEQEARGLKLETLIDLDAPRHKELRGLTLDWFKPSSLSRLQPRIDELARQSVERLRELGGRCDFAREIALVFPLQTILAILGLPESDYPRMLKLTQELFAGADQELQRGEDDLMATLLEFFEYFTSLTAARRAKPTDDLASLIANAEIDGQPLGVMEQLSYYLIIASAGHDTTSSTMAGGLLALIEHPDQRERLRADPGLAASATEEIIRWVSPVKHFLRNATEATTVGGHTFAPGDVAMLNYWSANFDERAFDQPFRFDVGRQPNRHLAFGFGAHFCLGAVLARMQVSALLTALVPELVDVELDGRPELSAAAFVSGLKHLPVSYSMR